MFILRSLCCCGLRTLANLIEFRVYGISRLADGIGYVLLYFFFRHEFDMIYGNGTGLVSNAPDQRPRATDVVHGTETQSRGSLHPVCSATSSAVCCLLLNNPLRSSIRLDRTSAPIAIPEKRNNTDHRKNQSRKERASLPTRRECEDHLSCASHPKEDRDCTVSNSRECKL